MRPYRISLAGVSSWQAPNIQCNTIRYANMQGNNIPVNPNWQQYKPKPVTLITNQLLVSYNMTQEMEGTVAAICPAIVILDEKEKK
eukprot:984102-Ditylum_brightwellii.AAC.1